MILLISLGCVPPKQPVGRIQADKSEYLDYWQATLRALPSNFPFPDFVSSDVLEGFIDVEVNIDETGLPTHATSLPPLVTFSRTAEAFVLSCKFQPARFNRKWISGKTIVKVLYNSRSKAISLRTQGGGPFRPAEYNEMSHHQAAIIDNNKNLEASKIPVFERESDLLGRDFKFIKIVNTNWLLFPSQVPPKKASDLENLRREAQKVGANAIIYLGCRQTTQRPDGLGYLHFEGAAKAIVIGPSN